MSGVSGGWVGGDVGLSWGGVEGVVLGVGRTGTRLASFELGDQFERCWCRRVNVAVCVGLRLGAGRTAAFLVPRRVPVRAAYVADRHWCGQPLTTFSVPSRHFCSPSAPIVYFILPSLPPQSSPTLPPPSRTQPRNAPALRPPTSPPLTTPPWNRALHRLGPGLPASCPSHGGARVCSPNPTTDSARITRAPPWGAPPCPWPRTPALPRRLVHAGSGSSAALAL